MTDVKEKFPIKDWEKKSYKLSKTETSRIISLQTMMAMGAMAEQMVNTYLNAVCLPRVGIKPSNDIQVEYDPADSDLFIYIRRTTKGGEEK